MFANVIRSFTGVGRPIAGPPEIEMLPNFTETLRKQANTSIEADLNEFEDD